ncbi:class I SAM-dependent methyltransferase [Paraflavitalea sp. CAU 1676]|uniref:class I SAM-dependent methyltransferase n=1 Tax=Paraflavitalea sp. CAU 1676 TaxID=3032598 RepID=UPI0023DAF7A6|nr:class I SAM-dependent methyltransferase [Paraflavitalea sp. CAU 1676]MDF2188647.1 class I SAM-dependent methyltransferase [Paraflavitalea sp. CAU 1676]
MDSRIEEKYIPALRFNFLTRYYDFLVANFLQERKWKSFFVQSFMNKSPHNILDVGCGTATLSILIKQQYPQALVTGIDGDEHILNIAARKIRENNLKIELVKGYSYKLPYPDNHFDVVSSSLMLHHLSQEDKHRTIQEVFRVLKPGGEFNIADWGKPDSRIVRLLFYIVQFLDGFKTTRDNVKGLIPEYLKENRFSHVNELKRYPTLLGSISIYQAIKS